MAINFCNPAFGTTIATSSVSADGYEPQNLLKQGAFGQWKGFLAEHFIKPPINITFSFPFKVDVHSIIIDPSVGSQKSSGIEIFTATVPQQQDNQKGSAESDFRNSKNNKTGFGGSSDSIVSTNIGKAYCNDMSPRLIQFVNRRYRPVYKDLQPPPVLQEDLDGVLMREFRCPFASCVSRVNQLVVRITRVQGGSVPALKKVEVWGQPSPSCCKPVIQRVLETVKHLRGLNVRQPRAQNKKENNTSNTNRDARASSSKGSTPIGLKETSPAEYPEEFVDSITCHMMVIPILLPSGHTVDQETLEKHNRIEATWGRPPNDPFTGVPFSAVSKPIPHVKLKVRLDRFLLMGGTAVKGVPRTAGSASDHNSDTHSTQRVQTSVLLQGQRDFKTDLPGATNGSSTLQTDDRYRGSAASTRRPRSDYVPGKEQSNKRKRSEMQQSAHSYDQRSGTVSKKSKLYGTADFMHLDTRTHTQRNTASIDPVGHEKLVSDSLDDALATTLASLPSFSRTMEEKSDVSCDSLTNVCINCKTSAQSTETGMYSMPCGHLICRKCTSTMTAGILCNHCNKSFKACEISRVHAR